jgi:hypothetical protein
MLDRPNICQDDNIIPFKQSDEPDEVDQAVAALTSAASKIYELMLARDERLMREFEHICGAALAINLVVKTVEVRITVGA